MIPLGWAQGAGDIKRVYAEEQGKVGAGVRELKDRLREKEEGAKRWKEQAREDG